MQAGMHMHDWDAHAGWGKTCRLVRTRKSLTFTPPYLHTFTHFHTSPSTGSIHIFFMHTVVIHTYSFTHTHSHRCAPPLSAWARLCDWQCADQALHTRVGSSQTMESAHRSQLMLLQPPTASLPLHTSCLALHTGQVRSSSSSANMRSSTRVYPASTSR